MLTVTAISVFILPQMILPLFIYQFMATQIFIISVIGMAIKLLSSMYFRKTPKDSFTLAPRLESLSTAFANTSTLWLSPVFTANHTNTL